MVSLGLPGALCVAAVLTACGGDPVPATRHILYTSQAPGGTEDIRLLDPESGASTVVAAGDSISSRNLAVWSPDGRRVAFVRELGDQTELYVLDSLGAVPRRVGTDLPKTTLFPDWSPDGTRLAVAAGDSSMDLGVYTVDVASGQSRRLRRDASSYRCPTWSPSGDRLLISAYHNASTTLVILDTMGAAVDTALRSDSAWLDCPHWSPRGDEILFTIVPGGGEWGWVRMAFTTNLAVVSLASRQVRQLTHDSAVTNYGRWSPDGEWIVFASERHVTPPIRDAARAAEMMQNKEIWVVRRDGSGLRRLTTNTYFDAHPSW